MRRACVIRFAAPVNLRAPRWMETTAAELSAVNVVGTTPGLAWAHDLGSSCALDDARGIGFLLHPRLVGRSILRFDLRGHGRSRALHDAQRGAAQYTWASHGEDMRAAVRASMSAAFLGGEGLGAAVALQVAATSTAPPGLVLMNPPEALAPEDNVWRDRCTDLAVAADESWDAVEALESSSSVAGPLSFDLSEPGTAATPEHLRALRREALCKDTFASTLRGHAVSQLPGAELEAKMQQERTETAGDAYGVPITTSCPVLVLAIADTAQASVATRLAARLQHAELLIAADTLEARAMWGTAIGAFMKKAWMQEFLTKRVMPQ